MQDLPKIILTDADGLASNTEPAFLILDITRAEVEAGRIGSVIDRLHVLTDTPVAVMHYRQSLVFQIGGYDADKRELPEIPEVRDYFKRLTEEWPYWLWFLARDCGAIGLLLSLLCRVQIVRTCGPPGAFGTSFDSRREVVGHMLDLIHRSVPLLTAYGVQPSDVAASVESAKREVFGSGGEA